VALPHRVDVVTGSADEANLSVSNLPSITDCPEEVSSTLRLNKK